MVAKCEVFCHRTGCKTVSEQRRKLKAQRNGNAKFYCSRGLPFVMGTTGGDQEKLVEDVLKARVYAVIAPQMGKQVTESHQSTKMDTSGTARVIVDSFQKLDLDYNIEEEIEMIRDSKRQIEEMKVPEEPLNGHTFHPYHIVSPDGMVNFEF